MMTPADADMIREIPIGTRKMSNIIRAIMPNMPISIGVNGQYLPVF